MMTQELKSPEAEALIRLALDQPQYRQRLEQIGSASKTHQVLIGTSTSLMITAADDSQLDMVWDLIDRCRAALLERGIRQWDRFYPAHESVAADIADKRLYCLTASGLCRAVVTIDMKQEAEYATVPWTTTEPALSVHRLCVDPATLGRGLGRQLMDYIETYAKHHRFAGLRLDAYSDNP